MSIVRNDVEVWHIRQSHISLCTLVCPNVHRQVDISCFQLLSYEAFGRS
jgi:hypothetical protein